MIVRLLFFFFFSSRRRHTRWTGDWSSDVCSSDLCLLAVCRCPRPRPSGAGCQHQTTAVKAGQVVDGSGVGPLALALTTVVDLAYPRGRERLPRWGAKVST